jgi:hypothetical protein
VLPRRVVATDEQGSNGGMMIVKGKPKKPGKIPVPPPPLRSQLARDRKRRFVVGRQRPTGSVMALPGRIARREIKGQTANRASTGGIATSYGLDGPGFESLRSKRGSLLQNRPDQFWNPPSLVSNALKVK